MTASTEVIWEECSLHLRRFILGRVHLEQDAEDVLQDVFVKIHNNLHSLKDEDKLEAWIFQIARNAIVDYYRLTKHTAVDISEYPDRWAEEGLEDDSEGPRGGIAACVRPMVDALPQKYREALMLTHFGGMAQNRLAGELGLSFSGAKSRVQRARKMLKDMLLECCHLEFDRRGSIIGYESVEPECAACNKEAPGQNSMRPIAGTCVY